MPFKVGGTDTEAVMSALFPLCNGLNFYNVFGGI